MTNAPNPPRPSEERAEPHHAISPLHLLPWTWPLLAAATVSKASTRLLDAWTRELTARDRPSPPKPDWTTPNSVTLELPTMQLRNFSTDTTKRATLVCAPYALHGATIADFAQDHSLIETLHANGLRHLFVTDWRSATPEMKDYSIDTYLSDLNVAVDEMGPAVDLIGLCQGGWLALLYAGRFPNKVRRLVLAGAPIDISGGSSQLSQLASDTPIEAFEAMVQAGDGLVRGETILDLWAPAIGDGEADQVLQVSPRAERAHVQALEERFRRWYAWTVDMPGNYYLQVVRHLFKGNEIARGQFPALGRRINLRDIRIPLFLLAARDDQVVAEGQLFATERLVATPTRDVVKLVAPCSHLSLFVGHRTMNGPWRQVAGWLTGKRALSAAS